MAWTAPMTAVSGELLTASEYNVNVRDNFLQLAPQVAEEEGALWQVDAPNRVFERKVVSHFVVDEDVIPTEQTFFIDCTRAGPFATTTTGSAALVTISCEMAGQTSTQCSASFEVSGSTFIRASNQWRITHDAMTGDKFGRYSITRRVSLNPGSNTFRMKYRTGGLGPFRFRNRELVVIPL